ncbi:flagellum-specific ATP synthase [Methylobacterium phyllostachyos]|uniref:Flagellum-specific ATP synthase n=1 Tax=Methylobacterium phyllostachyos TaxID=582672 RepID=A0A1H0B9M8_9HYPH|nr:flagellar protein export ATPase FliI [Methylobacterium phyllostachyos]SDN42384.1 flagellum-specific ATP synthase [Methylobacterium phyllostachyos]
MNALDRLADALGDRDEHPLVRVGGAVREIGFGHCRIRIATPLLRLGDRMRIEAAGRPIDGEVVRIDEEGVILKPFEGRIEAGLGAPAYRMAAAAPRPCEGWKDRVINALGQPIDGKGELPRGERAMPLDADPPPAMRRARVDQPLRTGVRAIDLFTPLCAAQRMGIFAGSGVGKTTLLSMLARCSGFDAVVVALVGERGREVREFLEGPILESRPRSVVVVATGDESPMMRRQAPKLAVAVAEYFRDRGQSVLLVLDSVTRFAHAAREVALAAGEPPVARGYPPSVFGDLPRLLERAGPGLEGGGSITGIFSVLIDGDDHNDPVADSIRGTLDGHIVLDRAIADQGRYPAINLLGSISRLADLVWTPQQRELVRTLKGMIARFEDSRDLRLMGGYHAGTDPELDQAVALIPKIYAALRQDPSEPESHDAFLDLANALRG